MCSDTKQRIVEALRQLMQKKPLNKITVSDLMDLTQMRRQSFYYHFQCIDDVVYWDCDNTLRRHLLYTPEEPPLLWVQRFLTLLEADRKFFRRITETTNRQDIVKFLDSVVRPQITRLVAGEDFSGLIPPNQSAVIDVMIRSTVYYFIDFVMDRKPCSVAQARGAIGGLFELLSAERILPRPAGNLRTEAALMVG